MNRKIRKGGKQEGAKRELYPYVPITLVLIWLASESRSFANPKSETLLLNSVSIKMLLDLISRCTTLGSIAS
jgi:hypothetical protein